MDISSKSILMICCETVSDSLYQACFMPVELMKILKLKCEDIVYFEVGNKGLVCEVLPKFLQGSNPHYEVVASYQGMHNVCHLEDFCLEEYCKISMNNIVLPTIKEITVISISVIMNSVDNVIKAKKNLDNFKSSLKSLLNFYHIMGNFTLSCCSHPLAEFLGISYLIINNISVNTDDIEKQMKLVGKININTEVKILKIESKQRHYSLIKSYPLLGGLGEILTDLKNSVLLNCIAPVNKRLISHSSGVILVGPPGCGKTSLVRQLCFETKASYICTSSAEILCQNERETLKNFQKVARKAISLSQEGPCIFFIDEFDSIGFAKTKETSHEDLMLINLALSIIDECKKHPFLFIIVATNRPYVLDKSFKISGRLEREILLSAPTLNQREEILNIYCKDFLPDSHPVLQEIALLTPGFVGADLKYLCEKVRENFRQYKSLPNIDLIYQEMVQLLSNFTPSIHKSLEFITEKPKFSSVGGLDQIKENIDNLLLCHSEYEKLYNKMGLKKPRGILFYGPRGCGKTRLVAHLASKKGYSFISANASHLLSAYVGESEKRIAALFHSARLAQPSIIFIDEIDGIFGSRESNSKGVRANLITELLQAMDGGVIGATSRQGWAEMGKCVEDIKDDVLVFAATNHPEKLDPALIRPGRFDHLIYIPLPNKKARLEILKLRSSKLKISENILEEVAEKSEGFTGAELENLITRAVMNSVLNLPTDAKEIHVPEDILREEFNSSTPTVLAKDLKRFQQFEERFK